MEPLPGGGQIAKTRPKTKAVVLPIQGTELAHDVYDGVIATVLSTLEISDKQYVELQSQVFGTCVITIFQRDMCDRDCLLAAALASANQRTKNTYEVQTDLVANAMALDPRDVIRGFQNLQRTGVLKLDLRDKGYCLRLHHVPVGEEFDELHATICGSMDMLERTQTHKVAFMHKTFTDALAMTASSVFGPDGAVAAPAEGDEAKPLLTKTARMNALIRDNVADYFDGKVPVPEQPEITLPKQLEQAVRSECRSFFATQPSNHLPTGRAIARIFHGIASPQYPYSMWKTNNMWRKYLAYDFNALRKIAAEERSKSIT
jgi:ATP-dependent DNA helicase Q4